MIRKIARSADCFGEVLQRHEGDWATLLRSLLNHTVEAAQGEADLLQREEERREQRVGNRLQQRGDH
eukprot:9523935-Alexandrium_andersonii.AAC.1